MPYDYNLQGKLTIELAEDSSSGPQAFDIFDRIMRDTHQRPASHSINAG